MIEVQENLYVRLRAFVKTMADVCKQCARPKTSCYECDLSPAPYLLSMMTARRDGRSVNRIDYGKRFDVYETEIRNAGRPLLAKEIDPSHKLCGRGLKYWSLRKMVKLGILKTVIRDGNTYFTVTD